MKEKPMKVKELINKLKKFNENMYITVNDHENGSRCIAYLSAFGEQGFSNYVDIVIEDKRHSTTQIESDCPKEIWNKVPFYQV